MTPIAERRDVDDAGAWRCRGNANGSILDEEQRGRGIANVENHVFGRQRQDLGDLCKFRALRSIEVGEQVHTLQKRIVDHGKGSASRYGSLRLKF